jgi:hypothetical protein
MNIAKQLKALETLQVRKLKEKHEHYRAVSSVNLVKAARKELQLRDAS